MQWYRGFEGIEGLRGSYVSIGNFDGVHLGHQLMLRTLVGQATRAQAPGVVLTFDPHPVSLLRPSQAPPLLTSMAQRAALFEKLGVEHLIVYPTDHTFLDLEPEDFFRNIVLEKLQARGLVEGPNFYYGKDRAGSVETLRRSCEAANLQFTVIPPVRAAGRLVSSSTVREALLQGNVSIAAQLLGRPYQVTGDVVHGAARGRTIGFPTANLQNVDTLLPHDGVYAVRGHFCGSTLYGAANLGPNPTFQEDHRKFEIHLLDFTGDLYGTSLTVEFLERIRDTQNFGGLQELINQLQSDIQFVRNGNWS